MTYTVSNNTYTVANGNSYTNPFVEIFETRNPAATDVNYQIQQRWWNKSANTEWVLVGFSTLGGYLQANWQQVATGAVTVETLTGNSGGAVSPDGANNINVVGDGTTINVIGNPGTHTLTISALGSGVLENLKGDSGTATPSLGSINIYGNTAPATSGLSFAGSGNTLALEGVLNVSSGGTGASTLTGVLTGNGTSDITANPVTQYSVLLGDASNAVTNVSGVGTAGQVLTSNGAGTNPTWQTSPSFVSANIQTFTISGTYTPTPGMQYCVIECVGSGGGGGGPTSDATTDVCWVGSGGGGGEYRRGTFTAAEIGVSQTVTIGAGGTKGSGSIGGIGNPSSVGILISSNGGAAGSITTVGASSVQRTGGDGGSGGTGGEFSIAGGKGGDGIGFYYSAGTIGICTGGYGGTSLYSCTQSQTTIQAPGFSTLNLTATGYGAGGSGSCICNVPSQATAGNAGSDGIVIITEYIS